MSLLRALKPAPVAPPLKPLLVRSDFIRGLLAIYFHIFVLRNVLFLEIYVDFNEWSLDKFFYFINLRKLSKFLKYGYKE